MKHAVQRLLSIAFMVWSFASSYAGVDVDSIPQPSGGELAVFYDDNGMPRCLEHTEVRGPAVLINWNKNDFYQRETRALKLDFAEAARRLSASNAPEKVTFDGTGPHLCPHWRALTQASNRAEGVAFKEGERAGDFELSGRAQVALAQVRVGATVYHPEPTASEYLARHPIADFTLDLNRQLTARYGVGFVSEIYKAYVEAQPRNQVFKQTVLDNMAALETDGTLPLQADFQNRVVLLVKGLGHEAKAADRFMMLKSVLEGMGARFEIAATTGFGDVRENAESVKKSIREITARGDNVVLASLSKGSVESVMALADLRDEIDGPRSPGQGRVESFVGLSGIVGPSFVADFITRMPIWLYAKKMLTREYRNDGLEIKSFVGLRQLGAEFMNSLAARYRQGLPKSVAYFNVIGVGSGNGLAKDPYLQMMQTKIIQPMIGSGYGANDGYVEYPGNVISADWVPDAQTLVIDGSHIISNGAFAGRAMDQASDARVIMGGLFRSIVHHAR